MVGPIVSGSYAGGASSTALYGVYYPSETCTSTPYFAYLSFQNLGCTNINGGLGSAKYMCANDKTLYYQVFAGTGCGSGSEAYYQVLSNGTCTSSGIGYSTLSCTSASPYSAIGAKLKAEGATYVEQ